MARKIRRAEAVMIIKSDMPLKSGRLMGKGELTHGSPQFTHLRMSSHVTILQLESRID